MSAALNRIKHARAPLGGIKHTPVTSVGASS
ncbi:hypothetical protein BH11PSE7_BH11PSE7_09180 [soil metagenome]